MLGFQKSNHKKIQKSKQNEKQLPRGVLKNVISIKLQSNFIGIALRHGYSVNLLHIFRTPFPRNTSGRLLLLNENSNQMGFMF